MVRVEKDKLIIEMEAPHNMAGEDLLDIQKGIIEAVRNYNYKDYPEPQYLCALLDLLENTLPSYEQQREIFKHQLKAN